MAFASPPPRGSGALSALLNDGLVLLPTANLWQLTAHPRSAALPRLLRVCPPSPENVPELIFPDLETLRQWCPRIHPKLDTLLTYHKRPLTCLAAAGPQVPLALLNERAEVAVRLAQDSFVYRLCEDLEGPLVASFACGSDCAQLPTRFGLVRSDVVRAATYTVRRRQTEEIGEGRAVRAWVRWDELELD